MDGPVWYSPGEPMWSEHIQTCPLRVWHSHVGDQLFYSIEEFEAAFPEGMPDSGKTHLDRLKEWIDAGFARNPPGSRPASDHSSPRAFDFRGVADHRDHVHVSLNEPPAPGTIMARNSDGKVRPAQAGDTDIVGIAGRLIGNGNIEISVQGGGVISSPGSVWTSPASDPLDEIERARKLMLDWTRTVQ